MKLPGSSTQLKRCKIIHMAAVFIRCTLLLPPTRWQ